MTIPTTLSWVPSLFADALALAPALALAVEAEALAGSPHPEARHALNSILSQILH